MTVKFDPTAFRAKVRAASMRAVVRGTEAVRNEAIDLILTSQKTGRVYSRRGVDHFASAPGEPPASNTGNLVNSITTVYDKNTLSGQVVVTALYGLFLEYGTQKMEPRPFLRPALDNVRDRITDDFEAELESSLK